MPQPNPKNLLSPERPVLRFTPTAWAKLLYLRDCGETEVGGFGISAQGDLLLVEDVQLVSQVCSWAHVTFDDASVANFFDEQVDRGRRPEEFGRIWIHTHPGDSPRPSKTDEETFRRVFGQADWAVMFILACGGDSYARLRYNVGPGIDAELPVQIDYGVVFAGCDHEQWQQEYLQHVQPQQEELIPSPIASPFDEEDLSDWYETWTEYLENENQTQEYLL